MPTQIVVPVLGESIVEATVSRWLKKEGDPVTPGEALVELETDKVNLEVGAEQAGVLTRIERKEGEDVKIGDVLGLIEETSTQTPPSQPAPTASPAEVHGEAPPPTQPALPSRATPAARRLAQEHDVDLANVSEETTRGRVTKRDVESYLDTRHVLAPPAPLAPKPDTPAVPSSPPRASTQPGREERVRLSRRRQTIARRLVEAQHTAAMLTTFNEIDMSAVVEMRNRHKESFKQRHGVGLGIVSFFVKAVIGALKEMPQLNAEIQGDEIVLKHYYDIGVAIGATEGLVVPVLRDADLMPFAHIEKGIKEFAQQAEDGTLSLEDLRGGTFTITNGGVFGSLLSTPILNPPQVGILGLHKIEERPIALNGQVVIRPMMYAALSYDHRVVDGRESVQFLVRIKQLVEDPGALLLEG